MGIEAIDPQSIRNVSLIGDPTETTRLIHRLRRLLGHGGSGTQTTVHRVSGGTDYKIRITEVSSHLPAAELERTIRVADGIIAVLDTATPTAPRLETVLRIADDHQVARLCLLTALDHPAADFHRALDTLVATRGATPLPIQTPAGTGSAFEGVIDLIAARPLADVAAEIYGPHWDLAERHYANLVTALTAPTPDRLHAHLRSRTRLGDIIPVLCSPYPLTDDLPPLLDAVLRYLPSPLDVCQPEHALDY